ncbi:MAG: MATE family efflux transporter [Proteobacteria bacterium]|nr:MATE family efflux transporter [Pseudomonadota bacterium]MCH8099209.1 MATE family efflux transporter [Pseudomonadota bacterium]
MKEPPKAKLTEGPVGRHLVHMTVPMLLGIATMMGQGLIDAWFLGQVGDRALAAFSFGFPMLMIITSVAIGLGAGTSSVVARAIGAQDHRRARRLATDSLLLSFLITATLAVIGVLTIDPLFKLLGAPADMIPMIRSFMTILYSGIPFLVVGMVGTSSMRATGDTRLPGKLMIAGALLNVVLDPILIFGLGPIPAMGLNGAAAAALLARGTMFIGTIYFLVHRLDMVSFNKPDPAELRKSWRDILHVGLPAAGTNAIIPVAVVLITAMIARFGPDAVAGFGVASRLESMVLVIYYALSSVIGPFVGQNLAAGREGRIQLSLRLCALFCLVSGLVIAVLLALFSGILSSLFSENEAVVSVTRLFLWIAPISYGAYGVVMVMNAAFNGLGKPMPAVYISVTRMIVLYLPLALIGMQWFGIAGIFGAYAIANLLSGLMGYVWAKRTAHNLLAVSQVHTDAATGHEQQEREP